MDFKELVTAAHDHGGDESLLDAMCWWYEHSDTRLQHDVWEHMECLAYRINLQEAEQIVRNMQPRGQYWTAKQIKEYLASKGDDTDYINYYLVMNMAYNDYYSTAKLFGLQNDAEFFYSIAKDFIEDPDAKPFKVEKYFSKD